MHRSLLLAALPLVVLASKPAPAANCDAKLLASLKGDYVGQQTGLRNEMKVDSTDTKACILTSQWTLVRGEKRIPGTMKLTLSAVKNS